MEYSGKGVLISKIAGGFQMVTNSENVKYVDKLLKSPIETTLSQAALEALAIISYKQPVTRIEIDNVRGVASDGVLQTLLEKRLIAEVGRGSGVGRPRLYGTTVEFLRHFGLKEVTDLPPLPTDEMGHELYKSALPEEKINAPEEPSQSQAYQPQTSESQEVEAQEAKTAEVQEAQSVEPQNIQSLDIQEPQAEEVQEPQQNA